MPLAVTWPPTVIAVVAGVLVVGAAVLFFRANFTRYLRITGYACHISALNTLAFITILLGTAALAWLVSGLILSPGFWRNAVAAVLYSIFWSLIGNPLLRLITRIVEVRYHL